MKTSDETITRIFHVTVAHWRRENLRTLGAASLLLALALTGAACNPLPLAPTARGCATPTPTPAPGTTHTAPTAPVIGQAIPRPCQVTP